MLKEEEIKEFIKKEYGILSNKLEYLPLEENGDYYLVYSKDKGYFLKIYAKGEIYSKSKKELKIIHNFLYDLNKKHNFTHSHVPFRNKNNKILLKFQGRIFILYELVEGFNPKKLTPKEYSELGKIISNLHNIKTSDFKNVKKDEKLSIEKRVLGILKNLEKMDFKKNTSCFKLKEFFLENKELILKMFYLVKKELSYIKKKRREYVFCHGDLHKGNILINKNKIYIIDWEHLKLGLPERDLMWFRENNLVNKYFLNAYKKSLKIDERALRFYILKKGLAEFVFFSESILSCKHGERENNKKIEFMKTQMKIFEKMLVNKKEY